MKNSIIDIKMSSLSSCPQVLLLRSSLLILIACFLVTATDPWDPKTNAADLERRASARRLAAAHVRTPIKSRSAESALRHDHELHYLEGRSQTDLLNSSFHKWHCNQALLFTIQVSKRLRRFSPWQGCPFRCLCSDVNQAPSFSSRDTRASC